MRTKQLITPITLLAVTLLIVIIPAERSGWKLSLDTGVIPFLAIDRIRYLV